MFHGKHAHTLRKKEALKDAGNILRVNFGSQWKTFGLLMAGQGSVANVATILSGTVVPCSFASGIGTDNQ